MKNYQLTIGGNSYNVNIKSFEDSVAVVEVNGSEYEVKLHQELKKTKTPKLIRSQPPPAAQKSFAPAAGLSVIKAPLPGVIHKIMIKEGEAVKAGQNLLILEAMKMENNILAEKAGIVRNIKIKEGDSVLQGDILLEVE